MYFFSQAGSHGNTYRLGSVKRPVYTRPPELGVTSHIQSNLTTMPAVQSHGMSDIFTPSEPVDTRPDERLAPLVATIAPSNSHSVSASTMLPYQASINSQSPSPSTTLPTLFSVNFIL